MWILVLVTLNWRFVCFDLKLKPIFVVWPEIIVGFFVDTTLWRQKSMRGGLLFSWQISHIGQLSILRILPNYYIPPSSTKDGNVMCLCVCLYVCVLCVRVFVCACNNFNRLLCVSRCSSKVSEFGFDQCVCVCL